MVSGGRHGAGVRGVLAGNRVSILPDGVLHIRDVRNEDQMSMYTCTTRNVLTDDEKSSGFAYLRVHGQFSLPPSLPLSQVAKTRHTNIQRSSRLRPPLPFQCAQPDKKLGH